MNSEEEQSVINEKFQKKLKQITKYQSEETMNLTKRLAIVGLAWNSTNAKNILNAIAFVLENPHELKEVKIFKSNYGKKNLETADKEEVKDCFFAIATFSTLDCALEAYNSCNTLDFPDENSFFTFKVVPDDKDFTDLPVDEAKIEDLQIFTKKKQNHKNLTNKKVKRIKEESEESVDERFKEVMEDDDFLIDENHTSFKKKK